MSNLLQCRLHVLRFEFLLVISASQTTPSHVVDDFIVRALQLCRLGIRAKHDAAYEAGFLAIHALVSCTDKVMNNSPIEHALGGDVEQSRMEYQAAFLAQYLTAGTEGKDKRQLILYAARLHNLLGLATISLQLYTEAKIKEMFNATLSHFLYTRISQIHPFDTTSGRNAIYPENDLNETIDKIQRLGIKMSDSILHSLDKQETYASVAGMLTAKRRVRSSLATHLLFVERRRIARLKGETVNESMEPSYESKCQNTAVVSMFYLTHINRLCRHCR
jgi:N-terminal acetyltransferase B complex non-catalytic subunit